MQYIPAPLDTSSVMLTDEIRDLIERLAENTHDVWARKRMEEGWTHGPQRNDNLKQHPCLVPYNELSETEKGYDRATAEETIKALLALGYKVSKPRARTKR